MLVGGSYISTGDEAAAWARYHFRPHFFQHAGFRVVSGAQSSAVKLHASSAAKGDGDGYESRKLLDEYLLLHFGTDADLLPFPGGPLEALHFPRRCAEVVAEWAAKEGGRGGRVLDIGCAVGGAAFELSRSFDEVVGLDLSANFIDAAQLLQGGGSVDYFCRTQGDLGEPRVAILPEGARPDRVRFRRADASCIPPELVGFDAVLMVRGAN